MKNNRIKMLIFKIIMVTMLTGCGAAQRECGNDIKMGCNFFFGEQVEDGVDGKNGADGLDGKDGSDGRDGQNCTVQDVVEGAKIECGDDVVVVNEQQQNPHEIVDIIDPCGDDPGNFDEVLLVTYDSRYIAYFEDGGRRFLSDMDEGNYMTTDRQKCRFRITVDLKYEEI